MSSRSRALALFAVPLAFSFALTSCQDGNDPAATTSPSESPAAASPTASPSPTKSQPPKPVPASAEGPAKNIPVPEMPPAAAANDDVGAARFLEHYFELMNYTLETYDTKPIERITSRSCLPCGQGFIDPIRFNKQEGNWQVGGKNHVRVTGVNLKETDEALVSFTLEVDAQKIYSAPNKVLESSPAIPAGIHGVAVLKRDSENPPWKLNDINMKVGD